MDQKFNKYQSLAELVHLPIEDISYAEYDMLNNLVRITYGIDKPKRLQKTKIKTAPGKFREFVDHPFNAMTGIDETLKRYSLYGSKKNPPQKTKDPQQKYNTPDDRAMARYFRAEFKQDVNPDNTVTLYHATPNADKILHEGIIIGTTGKNVGIQGVEKAAWFEADKSKMHKWDVGGTYTIIEVKVPVRYIRHTPYTREVYFEGGLKRSDGNIWIPVQKPKETSVIKLARLDYGD